MKIDLKTLQQACEDLDIKEPVYSARVVENRLVLHLRSGRKVVWPADEHPVGDRLTTGDLEIIKKPVLASRDELLPVTDKLHITPPGRAWKRDLVKAIIDWKKETSWTL